jgi:hypothetical protein
MAINTAIITTPEAAVKAQAEAQRKRAVAKALAKDGDSTGARFALAEAADLDRATAVAEAADLDRAAAASLDPGNALLDPLGAGRGPWLTTFAPILMSFSFKLVSDKSPAAARR